MRFYVPLLTLGLLIANTLTLVLLSADPIQAERWGFTPAQPTALALLTHLFVHASWLHWLKNALFLGLFGWYVERVLSGWRFALLYLLSGLSAVLVHWLMSTTIQPNLYNEGLVGASGAISGLVGYFAMRFYRHRVRLLWASPSRWGLAIPMWVAVLFWVVLQGVGAILDAGSDAPAEVGYWAHLGGFAMGFLLAIVWGAGSAGEREYLLQRAEQCIQEGAGGDALRWLQPLLSHTPSLPSAWLQAGTAWALLGDREEATLALQHALQSLLEKPHPDLPLVRETTDLLAELGTLATLETPLLERILQIGESSIEPAVVCRWLETLLTHSDHPNRPEWLVRYARLLQKQGQSRKAHEVLEQIAREYPDSLQAQMIRLRHP